MSVTLFFILQMIVVENFFTLMILEKMFEELENPELPIYKVKCVEYRFNIILNALKKHISKAQGKYI